MPTIYKTTIYDRKTGKVINREIVGSEDMSEEEYYKPMVEFFYKRMRQDKLFDKCQEIY
jgi:hypothetical protein